MIEMKRQRREVKDGDEDEVEETIRDRNTPLIQTAKTG